MRGMHACLLAVWLVGCGGSSEVAEPSATEATAGAEAQPAPPADLRQRVDAAYPPGARAEGQAGNARVRLVVRADGSTGDFRVVTATTEAFGEACIEALRGSSWTPGAGPDGAPRDRVIMFTCVFDPVP